MTTVTTKHVARARSRRGRQYAIAGVAVVLLIALCAVALARFAGRAQAPGGPVWSATGAPRVLVHALVRAPWGTLYAGTSRAVYSSGDGGATWQPVGHAFPSGAFEVWSVAAVGKPGDEAVLAAMGNGRVYRLARGATRWTATGDPIGSFGVYALLALPQPGVVLAGSDYGIFRSTDGGRTWAPVASPGSASAAVTAFARDPRSDAIYAGLAGAARPLRTSVDGGRTWRIPTSPLPPPSVEALLATSDRVYAGVMRAAGGQAVWAGGAAGFASIAIGLPKTAHGMALAATGRRLLVGTMGLGVYSRARQGTWTRLGQGPADGLVTSLLVVPGAHPVVLAGTDGGIYRLRLP